jgi:chromosomal replication initiator protein
MEAWERFLKKQEERLGAETVDRWLRSLQVVDFDACNLYLEAKDAFQLEWFEEQMREKVQKELLNSNCRPIKVHLTIASINAVVKNRKGRGSPLPPILRLDPDPIDPHATFAGYIPGVANEIVFKFLTRLAEGEEKLGAFNPIYIHGHSGTGKTHLLMAITARLNQRGIVSLFVRAGTFTEHVVNAIRSGAMREFRKAYRHVDVLLIDDADQFSRKAATQEELFHTFNALHTTGRQIVISGQKAPQQLEAIEPRLISRFEWGIILPLEPLTLQELETVVVRRCQLLDFPLQERVVQLLASAFQKSPKSLHRGLEALILRSHLENQKKSSLELSVEEVEQILSDLILEEKKEALSPEKILHATADFYGIRVDDILGKSQSHDCTLPRQVSMFLCRMELNMPFLKIGTLFGRDHSTVMSSVKQIQKRLEGEDKEIRFSLIEILKKTKL